MYKTYQEAKINCPEACVCLDKSSGMFFVMPSREGTTLSEDCEFAEAKDHCMTVKEFLDAGYRFEVGDLYINYKGRVCEIGEPGHSLEACNSPGCIAYSDNAHILRAATLREKPRPEIHQESEFYNKPRTKVEYVKCEFIKLSDAAKAVDNGDIQFNNFGNQPIDDKALALHYHNNGTLSFYRRIETPMTEREAFIEAAVSELESGMSDIDYAKALFDSGKFKLVN